MGTLNISLKTNKDVTQFKKADHRPSNMMRLMEVLKAATSGQDANAQVYVATSASNPVFASGTLTLTYNSISNGDTCVIAGVTLTCVTGTPSTNEFKKETDATKVASNLVALINAHTTLKKYVTASSALGVVTIQANQAGSWGNLVGLTGSTGIVRSAANLASGAGGFESTAVQVR